MSDNKLATKSDLQEMYNRIYPYLGGMPEMVANKFSKGDLYSTEEKMIGQWIDGKPLYQKTVTYTNPSAIGQNTINMLTLEEDATKDYIDSEIIFIANWGTAPYNHYKLPYYQYADDGTLYVDMNPQLKTGIAQVRLITHAYSYSANDIIFLATLKYTKTTDTAISIGSDTDYSTEEKIVGTWIDGKPLYKKTFSYDTAITVTSTENTVLVANLDSLNIDNAVNLMVSFKWNGISHNTPHITYVNAGEIYVVAFVNRNDNSDVIEFKAKRPSGTTEITEVKATIQYTKTTDTPNT